MKKLITLLILLLVILTACNSPNPDIITHFDTMNTTNIRFPDPGQIKQDGGFQAAREHYKDKSVRYLVHFTFHGKDGKITENDKIEEYRRLCSKGYDLYKAKVWSYKNQDEKNYYDVVLLLATEEELETFEINENYGYLFRFIYNGGYIPVDFDKCIKLNLSDINTSGSVVAEIEEDIINDTGRKYLHYTDSVFGFSVAFPATWTSECSEYYEASEIREATPDSGIYIYVEGNKEDYIYVYGQSGTIAMMNESMFEKQHFKNNYDNCGTLYIGEIDDKTNGQLLMDDNKHISAIFSMNSKVYQKNNQEIMYILQSILY